MTKDWEFLSREEKMEEMGLIEDDGDEDGYSGVIKERIYPYQCERCGSIFESENPFIPDIWGKSPPICDDCWDDFTKKEEK